MNVATCNRADGGFSSPGQPISSPHLFKQVRLDSYWWALKGQTASLWLNHVMTGDSPVVQISFCPVGSRNLIPNASKPASESAKEGFYWVITAAERSRCARWSSFQLRVILAWPLAFSTSSHRLWETHCSDGIPVQKSCDGDGARKFAFWFWGKKSLPG